MKVRVVMDTDIKRSYLTNRVKDLISLTLIGTQKLSIMTFGGASQSPGNHDHVRVGMKLRSGENMYLTMFTVPSICEPIHGQPPVRFQELYPHLHGLDLADDSEKASPHEVDMLVGSDF